MGKRERASFLTEGETMDEVAVSLTGKQNYLNPDVLLRAFAPQETQPPSAFARGVAEELKLLSELITAGTYTVTHFSLTVTEKGQKLEIEVA
jgi:hypothetical protein